MKEEVKAITKHARMSPKKVIEVTRVIHGMNPEEALDTLRLIPRKSAKLVAKTLSSAIANAENNHGMSVDQLVIKHALANQGTRSRRFRPAARGSAHPYYKRTTHITIILALA